MAPPPPLPPPPRRADGRPAASAAAAAASASAAASAAASDAAAAAAAAAASLHPRATPLAVALPSGVVPTSAAVVPSPRVDLRQPLSPTALPPPTDNDPAALPSWVPELATNVRADVYPVLDELRISESAAMGLKLSPELELDRSGVSSGYAERRQPWEFASCLPSPPPACSTTDAPSSVPGQPNPTLAAAIAAAGQPAPPHSSSSPLTATGSPNPSAQTQLLGSASAPVTQQPSPPASAHAPQVPARSPAGLPGTATQQTAAHAASSPGILAAAAHQVAASAPHAASPLPITTPTENPTGGHASSNTTAQAAGLQIVTSDKLRKIALSMGALRRAPPVLPQRQLLEHSDGDQAVMSQTRKRSFPLQKAAQPLDVFLSKLASGKHSTTQLSTMVPMCPVIIRSAGKVLDALARHKVPAQRAAWFIRIALLNECHKQARPDRAAPNPAQLWTKSLSDYMKNECDGIRSRRPNTVQAVQAKALFWDYVLDLARWQADEGLLDTASWLLKLQHEVRKELAIATAVLREMSHSPEHLEVSLLGCRIVLGAVERFEPEILQTRECTKALIDSLIGQLLPLMTSNRGGNRVHASQLNPNHAVASAIRARVVARLGALLQKGVKRYFNGDELGVVRTTSLHHRGIPASNEPFLIPEKMSLEELVDQSSIRLGVSRRRAVAGDSPVPTSSPMSASSFGSVLNAVPVLPSMPAELVAAFALQKFPLDGDPMFLKDVLMFELGSASAAVRFVCRWAVEGSSAGGSLTPITAATAVRALESSVERGVGQAKGSVPLFFREILSFMTETEPSAACTVSVIIAHLCLTGVFSVQAYMREISKLAAEDPRHLAYLELLPEPADRAAASARRSILRRKGLLKDLDDGIDEESIEMAIKSDLRTAAVAGAAIKARSLSVCLTAVDTVCNMNDTILTGRLAQVVAFLEAAGGLLSAVQLILRRLASICKSTTFADSQVADSCAGLSSLLRMSGVVAAAGSLPDAMVLLNDFRKRGGLPDSVNSVMEKCAAGLTERFSSSCHGWQVWVKTLGVLVRDYRGPRDPSTPAHNDAPSADVIGLRDRLMAGYDAMEEDRNTVLYEPNEAIEGALIPALRGNLGSGGALRILGEFPLCHSLYGVRATTALSLISYLASNVKSIENDEGTVWTLLRDLLRSTWIREACLTNPSVVSAAKLGDDVDMSAAIMGELLRGHPGAPWMTENRVATVEVAEILSLTDVFNASIAEMHVTVLVAQRREKENIDNICMSLSRDAVTAAIHLSSKENVAAIIGRIIPSVCHDSSDSSVKALSAGHLVQSATAAMADSFTDLVQAAFDKDTDRIRELAKKEASLRDLVKASLPIARLTDRDEVGHGVFEQLRKACGLLGRQRAEELLSICDTSSISVALKERLLCLLFTVVSGESAGSGASVLVDLLISAVPLLDHAGVEALLTALKVIVGPRKKTAAVGDSQPGGAEAKEVKELLERVRDADISCWLTRKHFVRLEATLGSIVESPISGRAGFEVYRKEEDEVRPVDPWLLLEGYGGRPDENSAIDLESFGCQGKDHHTADTEPVVRLKRTYSTFACLVR